MTYAQSANADRAISSAWEKKEATRRVAYANAISCCYNHDRASAAYADADRAHAAWVAISQS